MRIFITGLSGFIGQKLGKRLVEEGHLIFDPKNVDLRKHQEMRDSLIASDPDVIIHLAARTEVEKSFYEQVTFSDINYTGTVNLIEAARELKKLKLFIFSSTMETYGWQPISDYIKLGYKPTDKMIKDDVFNEDTKQNPNAPYAVAKVGGELYLKYASRAYGIPYCILRQTNTYGREDNDFFVVEQFITQMLKQPDGVQFGYDKPYRNFLYIDDLIDLYVKVLDNIDKAKNQVFCTGPDNAIQIRELAKWIASKLVYRGTIEWGRKRERPGEIFYLNSTGKKAKDLLDWEPKYSLDEGLDKTIEVWKNK